MIDMFRSKRAGPPTRDSVLLFEKASMMANFMPSIFVATKASATRRGLYPLSMVEGP